jgi:hypothetical protein
MPSLTFGEDFCRQRARLRASLPTIEEKFRAPYYRSREARSTTFCMNSRLPPLGFQAKPRWLVGSRMLCARPGAVGDAINCCCPEALNEKKTAGDRGVPPSCACQ